MKTENKTKLLRCRISEAGYNAFILLCDKKGINSAKALREAVKDWYNKNKDVQPVKTSDK